MQAIATKLGQLITPPCITGKIQTDAQGQPMCSVIEHLTDMQGNKKDIALQNCNENGGSAPCWNVDDRRNELQRLDAHGHGPAGDQHQLREQHGQLLDLPARCRPARPRQPGC